MDRKIQTSLITKTLAVAITAAMASTVQAASTEQQQIQELRQEVQALKALIQQQQQQQVQIQQVQAQPAPAAKSASPFSLKSKGGAEVNLYGFVRGDAAYQIEGGNGIFNRIHAVSLGDDNNATEDRFDSTATTTRLGLDFKGPVAGKDVGGKIEIDFRGTNDSVRIRHAYLTMDNWLLGQTTSSFLSGETTPEMLDFNSPLGIGTYRTPQVRYSDKINADTTYFVGLEKGHDDNRLPAATAKVAHKFAEGAGTLTGRALVQEVRARDVADETDFGWGLAAGVNFKPTETLTLNADYSHVTGDDKFILYTNGNERYSVDGNDIDLKEFDAFTLGATLKITPKLRSTLGYGAVFFDDAVGEENDELQQGWLNVMYNPVQPITLGAEYVYGERETADGQTGKDNRIGVMARYNF